MAQKVADFLVKQQRAYMNSPPEIAAYWTEFQELYNKKLWHQLTIKLLEFVEKDKSANLKELYENFISDFETRIKPLSLVELATSILVQITNIDEKLQFITKIKDKVKEDQLSSVYCSIIIGRIKLESGDFKGTKEIVESTMESVDTEVGITKVHAFFFLLASDYYQKVGDHAEYYRNALRYLGCCSTSGVDITESQTVLSQRAFTLALAAILGQDVFNFGELLLHPIVNQMKPEHEYMRELLYAFNSGDIAKFDALKPKWQTQPDLAAHEIDMRKKICLLCLMEMAFNQPQGQLTFAEIAAATHLPIGDVELLVMKALAKGLVKGSIDEVQSQVRITWVQPRVLNKGQISNMKGRLESWIKVVDEFSRKLETRAQEIIA